MTQNYILKINAAIHEASQGGKPSEVAEIAFALSILNSQITHYHLKISNLKTIVQGIQDKFMSTTPHLTIDETSRNQLNKTIQAKNQVLMNIGKKCAFTLIDGFLKGVIPVSRFYKNGEFSRMVIDN